MDRYRVQHHRGSSTCSNAGSRCLPTAALDVEIALGVRDRDAVGLEGTLDGKVDIGTDVVDAVLGIGDPHPQFQLYAAVAKSISRINALSPRSVEYLPVVRQLSTCLRRDIGRNPSLPSREMVRRRRVSFRQLCVDLCLGDAMMHGRGTAASREN